MTGLPESKGVYILIASVAQTKRLAIGRLGEFTIIPGFYAYVGSACGHGGIRARVSHHLESIVEPHWHIDCLLGLASPIEVWYAISDRKLEQDWAKMLQDSPKFRTPIPRFGSSDYHRTRTTHLFYSKRRPLFRWFEEKVREVFEPSIRASTVHSFGKRRHVVPVIPRRINPSAVGTVTRLSGSLRSTATSSTGFYLPGCLELNESIQIWG